MPLPDTNNWSSRIYELLKETDLENLSYAQFQAVAEKLFIEPENEDEMRRLVLVQLARMAVRGDWDGFLTGGGGSGAPTDAEYVVMSLNGTLTNERVLTAGSNITITDGGAGSTVTIAASGGGIPAGAGDMGSTFDVLMASGGLFGGNTMATSTFTFNNRYVHFVPIVFPKDVTISNIQYSITSGSFTGKFGLYSANSNGSPNTLLVETGLQSSVGSGYYSAGVSNTSVTAGQLYWIGMAQGTTSSSVGMRAMASGNQGGNYVYITDISNFNALQMRTSVQVGSDTGLPSPITTSELESLYGLHPMLGVGF